MTEQARPRRLTDGAPFWLGLAVVVLVAVGVLAVRCSAGPATQAVVPAAPLRALTLSTLRPATATMHVGEQATLIVTGAGPYDTVYEGAADQSNPAVAVVSTAGEQPRVQAQHAGTIVVSVLVGGSCASPAPGSGSAGPGVGSACSHLRRSLGAVQITVSG